MFKKPSSYKNPSKYLARLKRENLQRTKEFKPIKKRTKKLKTIVEVKDVRNKPVLLPISRKRPSDFHIAMASRARDNGNEFYLVGKSNACAGCGGLKFSSKSCECLSC